MSTSSSNPRRRAIKNIVLGSLSLGTTSAFAGSSASQQQEESQYKMKGNINHAVCRWCYGGIPLEEFALPQNKWA